MGTYILIVYGICAKITLAQMANVHRETNLLSAYGVCAQIIQAHLAFAHKETNLLANAICT